MQVDVHWLVTSVGGHSSKGYGKAWNSRESEYGLGRTDRKMANPGWILIKYWTNALYINKTCLTSFLPSHQYSDAKILSTIFISCLAIIGSPSSVICTGPLIPSLFTFVWYHTSAMMPAQLKFTSMVLRALLDRYCTISIYSVWPCDHDMFDGFGNSVLTIDYCDIKEISVDRVIDLVNLWVTPINIWAARGCNKPGKRNLLPTRQKVAFWHQI